MRSSLPSLPALAVWFSAAALAAAVPAQQVGLGGGAAPPAPTPPPAEPAELQPTLDAFTAHVRTTSDAERDVADAAWHLLAFSAVRETLRHGPHRESVKTLAAWLRSVQDDEGRFAPGGQPCARAPQLLATFAISLQQRESNYKLLASSATKAAAAGLAAAAIQPELTAEELVWLALLADLWRDASGAEGQHARAATDLAKQGLAKVQLGRSRRVDAEAHLLRMLLGDAQPADLTVAMCWPGDLRADPWHAAIGGFAVRRLDAKARRAQWLAVQPLLAVRDADGLWPAAADLTVSTTNAMLVTAIASTYEPAPAPPAPTERK